MLGSLRRDAEFRITHDEQPSPTLLAGFSSTGLAGLTAVDYLVDHLELEQTGHIRVEGMPSITPFEGGRPRYPTRLYSRPDLDVTVLVGELFIHPILGEPFATEVLDWTGANGVEEVSMLRGIPIPHGPEDHRPFFIATDDYREHRLENREITPMGSGFLDGVHAALVERGIDSSLRVGVFVTPVHPQAVDVEAALRLVETIDEIYELGVDAEPLEQFAAEVNQYYTELADRIEREDGELTDDRMFM